MSKTSAQARRYLDDQLARLRLIVEDPPPAQGWLRSVRDALGMSSAELAGRMGVGQSTISELESSEVRGTIKLDSLRRAAGALDCKLVYFLVPRTSLDDAVRAQARRKAAELTTADHRPRTESDIDELVEQLVDRPGLWSGSSEMD